MSAAARQSIFNSLSVGAATLCLLLATGCGKKTSSDSLSSSSTASKDSAQPDGKSETVPDTQDENRAAIADFWQEAIQNVASQKSRSIALNQTVNGDQMQELASASEAAELLLDQGIVDDAGLRLIVSHLPNLEHLRIRLSPLTDESAEALVGLSQLRVLNLPQSKIGAKGIKSWASLSSLEHVRLGGSQLDDSAMEALSTLPNLQSLHLIGPSITEAGLINLTKARKLSSLYIDDCQLSDAAWLQLKNSRPDLHVHLDQNHRDRSKK